MFLYNTRLVGGVSTQRTKREQLQIQLVMVAGVILASGNVHYVGGDVKMVGMATVPAIPRLNDTQGVSNTAVNRSGTPHIWDRRGLASGRCEGEPLSLATPAAIELVIKPEPQLPKAFAIIQELRPAAANEERNWLAPGAVRVKHYDELNGTIVFNLRENLPDKEVSLEMLCKNGIPNIADGVCCHKTCGGCGSKSCGSLPGGAQKCCSSKIKRSGRVCGETEPPCLGAVKGGSGSKGYLVVQPGKNAKPRLFEQKIGLYPRGSGCGNWGYGQGYLGYADPRLFEWNGRLWVLLNGCSGRGRRMYLHDVHHERTVRLWWHGEQNGGQQKNWTPFIWQGKLRLIYGYSATSALGILEVVSVNSGETRLVQGQLDYDDSAPYHGSTPLKHWGGPLYFGFAHTRHAAVLGRGSANSNSTSTNAMKVYRSVPMIFNADTFTIRFGPHVSFRQPDDALAKPWTQYAGRTRELKDVQFPFGFHTQTSSRVHYRLAVEYQDRCPAWAILDTKVMCSLFGKLIQSATTNANAL